MAEKAHVALIEARFYSDIADAMAKGAGAALARAGATFDRIAVPGAFELPAALRMAIGCGKYRAYVVLGCVIRGETSHYDIVCNAAAGGVSELAAREGIALGFGLLTCDTEKQAWERADPRKQNKGRDAAEAALAMLALKRRLAGSQTL